MGRVEPPCTRAVDANEAAEHRETCAHTAWFNFELCSKWNAFGTHSARLVVSLPRTGSASANCRLLRLLLHAMIGAASYTNRKRAPFGLRRGTGHGCAA